MMRLIIKDQMEQLKWYGFDPIPISKYDWDKKLVGLYFLMSGEKCVYIGKTEHALRRIGEHQCSKHLGGKFDSVLFEGGRPGNLAAEEVFCIAVACPELNRTYQPLGRTAAEANMNRERAIHNWWNDGDSDLFYRIFGVAL